ncbi:phosphoribosyl-AMP cyclohydrolase [Sulfuracidifex metallicus DSM 6482 = JCM 9184]|uniref:Phosphoribosyl-AMP cyclohydrolase n=1 Tax=Sulfuracidifex metallicus DSM 6482 = JCM 9184 TaxID=523847 RepID=A0A6A9QGD6_SULME|nr:phosphoribosyl-AMP cyclohydrolase [Sulfuracidifex metallicus]MUN28146.1 phosphoribosyl-AMP cyclohydrolase [Sulfuracidifex metallicus DSM 6482 = JCM 9184]WOE51929.1 phosphoribosyl-AMP cyclohydrolase [Sulfuracidifex metallicus DSM 6482 = JCM 9184]
MDQKEAEELVSKMNFRHDMQTIIAVLQHFQTKEILMVANMNKEAFIKTLMTGKAHFFSLSRGKLWLKGETSGNFQILEDLRIDCDNDAVVLLVNPLGPTCHTGNRSCFYRSYDDIRNG